VSDVPVSIIKSLLTISERHGIPRVQLVGAPSVSEGDLLRMRRVPWDAFCALNDRIEDAWRPLGGLAQLGRAFSEEPPDELRSLGRAVIPPAQFLRLVFALGTWAHPSVTVRVTEQQPNILDLQLTLDPKKRDCPSFFRICGVTMSDSTRLIGLPQTPYQLELGPHQAHYRFEVPPSQTVFARMHSAVDERVSSMLTRIQDLQAEVRELLTTRSPRQDGEGRLEALVQLWSLSPRQTDVLRLLSSGASNKEIGHQLGVAERTVEIHVTELLRKSGLENRARLVARFWSGSAS